MATPSRATQKLAVVLAFVAAVLSLAAVAAAWLTRGQVPITPLGGGLLMLALGIGGLRRIRSGPG
jgi:hypothetical protein